MATLLLDHLRSVFTTQAVDGLARATGEQATLTQKALDGLLPALTTGVINQAQTREGAATLYRLLTSTPFATDPSVGLLVDADSHRQPAVKSGTALLGQLFPDRPDRLASSTAQYSGVSLGSATTLTGLAMSILMGFLHQQLITHKLTEAQLAAQLRSETDPARSAIPAALASMLGWLIGSPAPGPVTSAVPPSGVTQAHREENEEKAAGFPWLRWLLIGAGLLLLLFLLMRSCNRNKTEATTTNQPTQESTTSVASDTLASDLDGNAPAVRVAVDLPGGRKLSLVEKSFTYSLAQFLATKGGQVPKVFTFDNLTFETDSARITAQARSNVDDLIQIMKAYPSLHIRIEGNTDSTGDDAINDPLSGDRADAVRQALLTGGIEASRVTTRERGDSKPVASNQTEAGRQKNRRIDVVITKL